MNKVLPILNLVLSVFVAGVTVIGLYLTVSSMFQTDVASAVAKLFSIIFVMSGFIGSAISSVLGFIFSKSKICLVAAIISAVALVANIVALIILVA